MKGVYLLSCPHAGARPPHPGTPDLGRRLREVRQSTAGQPGPGAFL